MRVNLLTGYCPKEIYGLSRYDKNLYENLSVDKELVCSEKAYLPTDIIKYRFMKKPDAQISHVTNETFAFALNGAPGKHVATVFDMGVLMLPEYGLAEKAFYSAMTHTLGDADHIITASEFMRNVLTTKFHIKDEKITRIYLALEEKFRAHPKKLEWKDEYTLIYVGNEKNHKNFMQVLETLTLLSEVKDIRFKLIKVGKPQSKLAQVHRDYIAKHNLNVELHDGYTQDDELIKLYQKSDMFISMSDYEGFGFPPLEACAGGLPVILKNSPTLTEIYGEVGHFVETPEQARERIIELICSSNKYSNSALNCYNFANKFSWKKVASDVEKVYEKVL